MLLRYKTILEYTWDHKNMPVPGEEGKFYAEINIIDFIYPEVFKDLSGELFFKVASYTLCYILSALLSRGLMSVKDLGRYLDKVDEISQPESHHPTRWEDKFLMLVKDEGKDESPYLPR